VKSAILSHAEFKTFNDSVTKLFTKWKKSAVPQLKCFDKESHPKPLIETIAEDLLETFKTAPLVDAYDIYQHLMDYWAATMQDDCYLIAADGWTKAAQPKLIHEEKSKKTKAKPDFVLGKKKYLAELVPPALIVRRWFADEQAAIEKLETDISALQREMEGLEEEYGAEEGAFSSLDKINRVEVSRRLDEVEDEIIAEDKSRTLKLSDAPIPLRDGEKSERDVLLKWINLDARITELNRKLKAAQEALTEKVAAKYPKLAEDEIKTLAVDDKWLGALTASVQGELDRVSQSLTRRVRQLAERYATPLPQLTGEVAALAARVDGHLKKMGGAWK
jgi:type I restriction enzyme M protein